MSQAFDEQAMTALLRQRIVEAFQATPGYFAGPLIGPVMKYLPGAVLPLAARAQAGGSASVSRDERGDLRVAVALGFTGTGFDPEPITGSMVSTIEEFIAECQQMPYAATDAAIEPPNFDEAQFGYLVRLADQRRLGPFDDQATAEHAAADPDAYTTGDRDGFLVELWIDGSGWNEGYDMVQAPVFVAYVATAHEADDVMRAIETLPHPHRWTGFEARMRVGSSTANRRSVADIVNAWTGWVTGPEPQRIIP